MGLRRHARAIAADEAPQRFGVFGIGRRHQRQEQLERDRHIALRRLAGMNVPDRIAELLLGVLTREAVQELLVIVDIARDHVEIQPLGGLRLAIHEQRQRFRRGIAQPLVDGQAIALRLGNLLALVVEEQLVVEAFRRLAAERLGDLARQFDRVDQVLAGHFVIDAERGPAHRPVGLPLQFAVTAGDRHRDALAGFRIVIGDGAGLDVMRDDRHLQHNAGARADRQERRVAGGALLAQARQHDRHHLVEPFQHLEQRGIESAGLVVVGGAGEFVVEAERVEEAAQPRVVMRAERRVGAERVGHAGQRLAEMLREQLLVRHVVRHLAQPVHVVGKRQKLGLDLVLGQHAERVAHHGGAGHFAERADMRQAGGAIAGLEQHLVFRRLLQPRHQRPRLLERPSIGLLGDRAQITRGRDKVGGGHH